MDSFEKGTSLLSNIALMFLAGYLVYGWVYAPYHNQKLAQEFKEELKTGENPNSPGNILLVSQYKKLPQPTILDGLYKGFTENGKHRVDISLLIQEGRVYLQMDVKTVPMLNAHAHADFYQVGSTIHFKNREGHKSLLARDGQAIEVHGDSITFLDSEEESLTLHKADK